MCIILLRVFVYEYEFRVSVISIICIRQGWDDTSIHNPSITFTPHLTSLKREGIVLLRHHTYLWCSPTRRGL